MTSQTETSMTEVKRAAVSFLFALPVAGLAVLFYLSGGPLFRWVSIVPALISLLLVYATFHSLFASGSGSTTITITPHEPVRGEAVRLVIAQRGPVRLESLRANLVCEIAERQRDSWIRSYPYQINVFEVKDVDLDETGIRNFDARFAVPPEAEPTIEVGRRRIEWRLEVWGKVRRGADFMRPFPITVV